MSMWLYLGLEDGVDGVHELGADLGGEVHGQRGVLDRGDGLRRVGELPGGELLRRGGGVVLGLLERVDCAGQRVAEAAAPAGRCDRRGLVLAEAADRADAPLARTNRSDGS